MKRNLLNGIILMSALALSSCSTLNQLSKTSYTGDDVYFTKAQAGDSFDYSAMYTQAPARVDDYYYYGDYESRINRFGYYSPFAYDDDFYYGYNPYLYDNFSFGYGFGPVGAPMYNFAYAPIYDLGVYSAFDFGYGNYWGYGNYGYGYAYTSYIYGGGTTRRNRINTNPQFGGSLGSPSTPVTGSGLAFSRGGTGSSAATALANGLSFSRNVTNTAYPNSRQLSTNAVFPGRTSYTSSTTQGQQNNNVTRSNPNTTVVRPASENPRTFSQPSTTSSSSSNSGGGGSTGSSSSSGGGGRPVRP